MADYFVSTGVSLVKQIALVVLHPFQVYNVQQHFGEGQVAQVQGGSLPLLEIVQPLRIQNNCLSAIGVVLKEKPSSWKSVNAVDPETTGDKPFDAAF